MKTIKVSEAQGPVLDWLVAKCEGKIVTLMRNDDGSLFPQPVWADGLWQQNYSTDWSQGGPIIERECITTDWAFRMEWGARLYVPDEEPWVATGPTPLIAAMRCYVASKLGETAEVPEELL